VALQGTGRDSAKSSVNERASWPRSCGGANTAELPVEQPIKFCAACWADCRQEIAGRRRPGVSNRWLLPRMHSTAIDFADEEVGTSACIRGNSPLTDPCHNEV
jgi:hypothetical protein